jgi:arylsulfatase A-like enzyme
MTFLARVERSIIIKHLPIVLGAWCVLGGHSWAAEKPNIVIVLADDLGYADVLFNPQHPKEVTTPHLDSLAKEGVICRQGYVTGHVCSPTRAGLMTGRYQQRFGLYTAGEAGSGLPMAERIFPQFLKAAGYVSIQIGKWHLGPTPEWSPALRGFDEVFGFLGRGAHDYFKLDDPNDPIYRGTTPVKLTGYLTDLWGEEAMAFIERHKASPFFLYLAFNAVHAPLQAPADEIAKFNTGDPDRNTLLAMGKRMDDAIGSVVAKLKHTGVWENTLLFFISDNGGPLAQTANNTPLRGGKHQDYEGGIRVPFVVCWPTKLKPGESQAVVSSLDILPTALAAAGLPMPADKPLDGMNILPLLRGEVAASPRNLFWCSGSEEGWWAIRSGDWKLVGDRGKISLFDLSKDVSEKNDLASQMPEKAAELARLHDVWLAEMADPIKGEAKRYGMPLPEGNKPKTPKSERKKKTATASAAAKDAQAPRSLASAAVQESFAKLPGKPWKAARGDWTARDGAIWASPKAGNSQEVLLRGPAIFRSGTLSCELNLAAGSRFVLRVRGSDGESLIRTDIGPDGLSLIKLAGERHEVLKRVSVALVSGAWHKVTLKFDGPELYGELDSTTFVVTDAVVDREKAEVNFLISDGVVGLRNFSLTPVGSPDSAAK